VVGQLLRQQARRQRLRGPADGRRSSWEVAPVAIGGAVGAQRMVNTLLTARLSERLDVDIELPDFTGVVIGTAQMSVIRRSSATFWPLPGGVAPGPP
jgi:hypothetical protein